jgi:stage IV sporulation protein FB
MVKKAGKTEIRFQFIYVAIMCLVLVLDKRGGIFFCFLASFFHEIGHIIVLLLFKQPIEAVEFSVFDIKIRCNYHLKFFGTMAVILSGVATNFLLALIFIRVIPLFAYANLFMGIFNILPVSTLDGGQALKLLLNRFINRNKSVIIVNILTVIVSIPVFSLGILILLNTGYNFSFLALGIYLILTLVYNKDVIN